MTKAHFPPPPDSPLPQGGQARPEFAHDGRAVHLLRPHGRLAAQDEKLFGLTVTAALPFPGQVSVHLAGRIIVDLGPALVWRTPVVPIGDPATVPAVWQ